jgi:G3E family GTPase
MKTVENRGSQGQPVRPARLGKLRWVLITGFLGAGKTTAAIKLTEYLNRKGLKTGIITNDHGQELVDTALLRARGLDADEVEGGCFSARFTDLSEAAERLNSLAEMDVLIAETLGSSTDLAATVANPILQRQEKTISMAPVSVLVDPFRVAQIYGREGAGAFSEKLGYVYRKQLEDADLIVLNKIDLVSETKVDSLRALLKKEFPRAHLFFVSARSGEGMREWFECVMGQERAGREPIAFDYEAYAQASETLGWLNCSVRLSSVKYWDGAKLLQELAGSIQSILRTERAEIAHLKMILTPDDDCGGTAMVSLTRNSAIPEVLEKTVEPVQSGRLLLNLRAEGDPETLHAAFNQALLIVAEKHQHLFARLEHCEHFRASHRGAGGRINPENRL